MISSTRIRWMVPLIAACALLAGPVAIASASNNSIIATYNHYGVSFGRDQSAVSSTELKLSSTGNAKPLQKALAKASAQAGRFANALGRQSAGSSRYRSARMLIVSGLRGIAKADGSFAKEIKHHSVTKGSINRFNRQIAAANKKLKKGEGLLPHF